MVDRLAREIRDLNRAYDTLLNQTQETMAQPSKVEAGGRKLDELIIKEVEDFESLYYEIAELNAAPNVQWINIYFKDDGGEFVRDRLKFF